MGRMTLNYLLWDAFKQLPCLKPDSSLGDYDEQLSKRMYTEQTTMEKFQSPGVPDNSLDQKDEH